MEFVAEVCFTAIGLELDDGRFQSFVAFAAITCGCKGILTVVAGAARFPFDHIGHAGLADNGFVGECFGMAIFAAIRLGMESVAERSRCNTFQCKCDLFRLQTFVAAVAVCRYGKNAFAVMAGAAGASLFHFGHSHRFFLPGYDDAVVAPLAGAAGFGNVGGMAEYGGTQTFYRIGNIKGFAAMTA